MTAASRSRVATAVAVCAAAVALIAVYALFDPESPWFPRCIFKTLTGYDCPGCGAQRAFHALLHGHPVEAVGYNPLLAVAVPWLALVTLATTFHRRLPRLFAAVTSPTACYATIAVFLAWWVGRNILF